MHHDLLNFRLVGAPASNPAPCLATAAEGFEVLAWSLRWSNLEQNSRQHAQTRTSMVENGEDTLPLSTLHTADKNSGKASRSCCYD